MCLLWRLHIPAAGVLLHPLDLIRSCCIFWGMGYDETFSCCHHVGRGFSSLFFASYGGGGWEGMSPSLFFSSLASPPNTQ